MLKVYDRKMKPLYNEDKKVVHKEALWHKVATGVLFNKSKHTLYFQTIYPKESYGFDRPDYIDFSVGGHVEDEETVLEALYREAKEEINLNVKNYEFLGIRICNCDPAPTYKIREFQFFYGLETEQELKDMDFSGSDAEVKSVIEVNIDDFLALLLKEKNNVKANEITLDKETRKGVYKEGITLKSEQIIPDYFNDKSILEKILTLKAMIKEEKPKEK